MAGAIDRGPGFKRATQTVTATALAGRTLLDVFELKHLADTAFALDHLVVDEMRKMKDSTKLRKPLRLWWSAAFAASLLIALPACAASNAPSDQALIALARPFSLYLS